MLFSARATEVEDDERPLKTKLGPPEEKEPVIVFAGPVGAESPAGMGQVQLEDGEAMMGAKNIAAEEDGTLSPNAAVM